VPDLDAKPERRSPTIFLSYASEDRAVARTLGEVLPAYGLEVWYDESELGGGDLWDQKIRRQIRECDYFMPLVSAQTEARREGYFRREWRLAVERTLDMVDDHLFLLPIVIDDTDQSAARVPEKFLAVQWLKVPAGRPTPAFESLCRRIAAGEIAEADPKRKTARPAAKPRTALAYPEFPKEEPGQRVSFWAHIIGWVFQSARIAFRRLPRWARVVALIWLGIVLLSRGCTPHHHEPDRISPAAANKLKAIAGQYQGSSNAADIAKLGDQIAREFASEDSDTPARKPILAVPFTAPVGNAAAEKVADSVFAMVYGRVAIAHHGQVGLSPNPLPACDLGSALERGRASHASYVLCGAIDAATPNELTVKIATVADKAIHWSKSYPVNGADPATVASEVAGKVPSSDDD
jgi:hypothetical protein